MSEAITGGCACGKIRYESEGDVEFAFHCHCRKCQRATGSGHSSAFAMSANDVALTGEVRYFEHQSDSGYATHSGFCPTCGSPIVSKTAQIPDRLYFYVATLDQPSNFEPQFVVFEDAALPWDHMDPSLSGPGG